MRSLGTLVGGRRGAQKRSVRGHKWASHNGSLDGDSGIECRAFQVRGKDFNRLYCLFLFDTLEHPVLYSRWPPLVSLVFGIGLRFGSVPTIMSWIVRISLDVRWHFIVDPEKERYHVCLFERISTD